MTHQDQFLRLLQVELDDISATYTLYDEALELVIQLSEATEMDNSGYALACITDLFGSTECVRCLFDDLDKAYRRISHFVEPVSRFTGEDQFGHECKSAFDRVKSEIDFLCMQLLDRLVDVGALEWTPPRFPMGRKSGDEICENVPPFRTMISECWEWSAIKDWLLPYFDKGLDLVRELRKMVHQETLAAKHYARRSLLSDQESPQNIRNGEFGNSHVAATNGTHNRERTLRTKLQRRILEVLSRQALTKEMLLKELLVDAKTLYADGGVKELMNEGVVRNNRKIGGYFRPDAPPT